MEKLNQKSYQKLNQKSYEKLNQKSYEKPNRIVTRNVNGNRFTVMRCSPVFEWDLFTSLICPLHEMWL